MRQEIHFNFNGQWSYDMGIIKASVQDGLFEDLLVASKSIVEEKIDGRDKPYFYGVEREPLSFPLPIYFKDDLTVDKVREILRWLDTDTYSPFYMIDKPERIWYAMVIDDVSAIHNGIKEGYMELTMRTSDVRTYTPFTMSELHTFGNNTGGEIIEFENNGDFDCEPIVHIKKFGNGNITIQNLSKYTGDFTFSNLNDQEQLIVDCGNKDIESDSLILRYDDFSDNYLTFVRGVNRLKVIGNCEIRFETQFKTF
ncbi:phage tail domain-containing protein [Oceanobacillus massiliensis]|uniref:phage tail domain-containing protein n=1 Tax=Oceanobacillus massiliensis TaxID=1465765 RepID=UPI0030177495